MNTSYRQLVATYKTQQYYVELYDNGANPEYRNALAHWTNVLNHQARQQRVNVKFLPTEIELLEGAEREAVKREAVKLEAEPTPEPTPVNASAKKAFRLIDREARKYDADRDNYTVHPRTLRTISTHLNDSWLDESTPCRWLAKVSQLMGETTPTEYYFELLDERAASIADGTAKQDLESMYFDSTREKYEYTETVVSYDPPIAYGWLQSAQDKQRGAEREAELEAKREARLEAEREAQREAQRLEAEREAQREAQRLEAEREARIALDYIDREALKWGRDRNNYYINPRRYQCIMRHLWSSWYIDTNRSRKWLEDLLCWLDADAPNDYYYQLLEHRANYLSTTAPR